MLPIILICIGSVIAVILIIALMMKKSYTISADVIINRKSNEVFDYVKHIKNQENYSVWIMADPNIKLTYTGTDATVGFKAAWVSDMKNVGVGEQEIKAIKEGERYDVEIRFEKPFKGINQAYTTTTPISENKTKVTTTFSTRTAFPMNIMVPMIKKMLTKDMNENFNRLKKNLETN